MSIVIDNIRNHVLDNKTKQFLATNIKGLMSDTLEWMEARNTELRAGSEFQGTPAEAKLFATLRGKQRSISELARVLGVSRQAVHNTVHKLIAAGVVELINSPSNQRDKLVRITERGHEVQKMAAKNLREIEEELADSIGRENLELVRRLLIAHLQAQNK
ncbi:MAG: MarR family transcriptional regulator [Pseudomonadota bacterium]